MDFHTNFFKKKTWFKKTGALGRMLFVEVIRDVQDARSCLPGLQPRMDRRTCTSSKQQYRPGNYLCGNQRKKTTSVKYHVLEINFMRASSPLIFLVKLVSETINKCALAVAGGRSSGEEENLPAGTVDSTYNVLFPVCFPCHVRASGRPEHVRPVLHRSGPFFFQLTSSSARALSHSPYVWRCSSSC